MRVRKTITEVKMKYFHIEGKIDRELLNKFLLFCNENGNEAWTIVINSVGGMSTVANCILYVINSRFKKCNLICLDAYSAAFYILYNAKCKKTIVKTAKGMYHLAAAEMYMSSNIKPSYTEDECIIKNWEQDKTDLGFAKKFMTPSEFKKFKQGSDIYFTFKRMCEIFPDAEII